MSNNLKRPRTSSSPPSPPSETTLESLQRQLTEQRSRTAELERTVRELNHNLHNAEMMRRQANEKLEESQRKNERLEQKNEEVRRVAHAWYENSKLRRKERNEYMNKMTIYEMTVRDSSDGDRLVELCRKNVEQVFNVLRTNFHNNTTSSIVPPHVPMNVQPPQLCMPPLFVQQQNMQQPLNVPQQPPFNDQALMAAVLQHQHQQQVQQQLQQLWGEHLIRNPLVNHHIQPAPQEWLMPVQQPAEIAPIQQVSPVMDSPANDDYTDEEIHTMSLSDHESERTRRIVRRLLSLSSDRAQNVSSPPQQGEPTAPRAEQPTSSGAGAPTQNVPVDAPEAAQRQDAPSQDVPRTSQMGPSAATRAAPVAPQQATTGETSGALQNTPTAPQQAHPRATSGPHGPRSTPRAPQQAAPGIGSRAVPGTQATPRTAPRTAAKDVPEEVTLD